MAKSLERFSIVIDSNEYYHGNTWVFPGYNHSVKSLLKYGCDYAVRGQLGQIGVERKAYSDLVACLGSKWDRFQKQLDKLQRNRICCVIVEGNIDDPIPFKSMMIHDAIVTQVAKVTARGIPVVFAGSRPNAALLCVKFMREAIRRIQDG